jgi:hypothetical protein
MGVQEPGPLRGGLRLVLAGVLESDRLHGYLMHGVLLGRDAAGGGAVTMNSVTMTTNRTGRDGHLSRVRADTGSGGAIPP